MADFSSSSLANCEEGQSMVEVCNFCGDKGFENALIECSECCEILVHQYCLGMPPGAIDDNFSWICEFCKKPSTKRRKKKKRKRHPCLPQCESPLTLGSKCRRIRKEKTEDESFSSTTEVSIAESSNTKDNTNANSLDCSSSCMVYYDGTTDIMPLDYDECAAIPIPNEEQLEPLLTMLQIRSSKKTECESNNKLLVCWKDSEGGISSLMENPKEITRGVVLLATPYGEIFIDEGSVFCDEGMGLYVQPLYSYFAEKQISADFCSLETDMLDIPPSKHSAIPHIPMAPSTKKTLVVDEPTQAYIASNPFGLEGEHLLRFQNLAKKRVESPRYLDVPTLERLGIHRDVFQLFEAVRLVQFAKLSPPAHRILVLEFLSTYDFEKDRMSFRLGGEWRNLSLSQFCKIFKLPPPTPTNPESRAIPPHQERITWASLTTSERLELRATKASEIKNPAFRIVRQVFATGLFARGDSIGTIEKPEIHILTAMVNPANKVDIGYHFAKHLYRTAQNSKSHIIHGGGLITCLAEHFKCNPVSNDDPAIAPKFLDEQQLAQYRMMKRDGKRSIWFYYQGRDEQKAPIPPLRAFLPHAHTDISQEENWLWQPSEAFFNSQVEKNRVEDFGLGMRVELGVAQEEEVEEQGEENDGEERREEETREWGSPSDYHGRHYEHVGF